MFNNNGKKTKELEDKVEKMYQEQREFLLEAHKILKTVLDNDKRKFMYELQQKDVELMKDGEKYRSIVKIIK